MAGIDPRSMQGWNEPPRPRRRHPRMVLSAVLLLVLGLVGTLVATQIGTSGPNRPKLNQAPFFAAVAALARQPMVHYTGSTPGVGGWSFEVTSKGQMTGSVTVDGRQMDVLVVGGATYVKPSAEMLDGLLPSDDQASSMAGKWITGLDGGSAAGLVPQLETPLAMASQLFGALMQGTDFPLASAPATRVGTVAALEASTPDGDLYVTAASPYRVLQIVPSSSAALSPLSPSSGSSGSSGSAAPVIPTGAFAAYRTDAGLGPKAEDAGAGAAAAATTTLAPMTEADEDQAYSTLKGQTAQTSGAMNAGVTTAVDGDGEISCSTGGCEVTDTITTSAASSTGARLSGTVTVDMTADVTVQGQGAGSCTAQTTMGINATAEVECEDGGAGAVIEEDQAQAQEQADESGESVEQELDCEAEVEVVAEAAITATEIAQEVDDLQGQQEAADQAARSEQQSGSADEPGALTPDQQASLNDALGSVDAQNPDTGQGRQAGDSGGSGDDSAALSDDLQQLAGQSGDGDPHILLGIDSPSFRDLTTRIGAQNLMGYPKKVAQDLFLDELYNNPGAKWSVSVDGFHGQGLKEQMEAAIAVGMFSIDNPGMPMSSLTQWEMAQLWLAKGTDGGNGTIGDVDFYEDGRPLPNPWA
jgi:hypothetical protein